MGSEPAVIDLSHFFDFLLPALFIGGLFMVAYGVLLAPSARRSGAGLRVPLGWVTAGAIQMAYPVVLCSLYPSKQGLFAQVGCGTGAMALISIAASLAVLGHARGSAARA